MSGEHEWIQVGERLPDDDMMVMIAPINCDEPVWLGYHDADGWFFPDAMPAHVSHWKPMPPGPQTPQIKQPRVGHGQEGTE